MDQYRNRTYETKFWTIFELLEEIAWFARVIIDLKF